MAAILADIQPGDEVIMPSYTFVSTANAFVLRDGIPVFVDIREDTLNIDERLIEAAITPRTRAIVPVHYAGVACEMDTIMSIARKHNLLVIEDAAQGVMATYKGQPLGSIGDLGCYSFHETKNIISGEGGALLINNSAFAARAEIIREKGTNRSQFFRGQVDKYSWVDFGSSYLPGELIAAFLWAQMEDGDAITAKRLEIWDYYHQAFEILESNGRVRRPIVPDDCGHNAHMYYLLLRDLEDRTRFISSMKECGVHCVFHYLPLHSSDFYSVFSYLTSTKQDSSIANFGIYSRKVIKSVLSMQDSIRYFPAMVQWVGFSSTFVNVKHSFRYSGRSTYNLRSLCRLAANNIISFSDKPLRLAAQFGFMISSISLFIGAIFFVGYLLGLIEVAGYASLIISIWFTSGVNIFVLGLVGIYVGKAFEKIKGRPVFLIDESINNV